MAVKKLTYVIEVNTETGKVAIDGLTKGFVNAELAANKLNNTLRQTGKNAGQAASKAGLAGAVVTELGRTVSDANYGMMAMANNIQQVSTLFITLISTTGGLTAGMKALWTAITGPLGLILAFQLLISVLEKDAIGAHGKAEDAARKHREELDKLDEAVRKLNEGSQWYVDANKDIVRAEENLKDLRLNEPTQWKKIAAAREDIIDQRIRLLKAEKESRRGLMSPKEEFELNKKIYELERERARVLGEEFSKREKDKPIKTEILGITPIAVDNEKLLLDQATENLSKFYNDAAILDAQRTAKENEQARSRREAAGKEARERIEMLGMLGDATESFGEILGAQTAAGKLVASAGALISTYAAVTKALDTPGLGLARIPYAIAVGAFGLARVAQINRVKVPNSGGGGGGGGQAANLTTTQAPTFNIVGSSNASQLRDAVEGQLNRPVKAYVTTKDIRSNEELDRNTRRGATIG